MSKNYLAIELSDLAIKVMCPKNDHTVSLPKGSKIMYDVNIKTVVGYMRILCIL